MPWIDHDHGRVVSLRLLRIYFLVVLFLFPRNSSISSPGSTNCDNCSLRFLSIQQTRRVFFVTDIFRTHKLLQSLDMFHLSFVKIREKVLSDFITFLVELGFEREEIGIEGGT